MQSDRKLRLCGANVTTSARLRRRWAVIGPAVMEAMETRLLRTAFAYTGTVQTYTVPQTANYNLTVGGAAGAGATNETDTITYAGGSGALLSGDVTLTAGTVLDIVVGGAGASSNGSNGGGGGGGGTFVYVSGASAPLVVAGGGGGASGGIGGSAQYGLNGGNGYGTDSGAGGANADALRRPAPLPPPVRSNRLGAIDHA